MIIKNSKDYLTIIQTLFIIWITLFVSIVPAGAGIFDDLEAAMRAFRAEKYDEAIDLYTKIIRDKKLRTRDRAVTYLLRGEAQKAKGDALEALKDFTRAIKIKPNYSHAYYFRGLVFEEQDKLAEAYQDVRKALSYKPDHDVYKKRLNIIKAKLTNRGEKIPE